MEDRQRYYNLYAREQVPLTVSFLSPSQSLWNRTLTSLPQVTEWTSCLTTVEIPITGAIVRFTEPVSFVFRADCAQSGVISKSRISTSGAAKRT